MNELLRSTANKCGIDVPRLWTGKELELQIGGEN